MSYNLDFSSYNNSWLTGFIKSNFDNYYNFIDLYFKDPTQEIILDNSIIFLDGEDGAWLEVANNLTGKNILIICKIKSVYDQWSALGFKCLYYPYWHVVDDAIALKKLLNFITPTVKNSHKYSFCCLNRNQTLWRNYLIDELSNLDLIKHGYVTYINPHREILGLQPQPNMDHYVARDYGFERHNHYFNTIGYSSNVANYYYIRENINAPINISLETTMTPWFPTEKSFLAFFTKKIPIVLAEPNRIVDLEDEGFDVFSDYVNHSYDSILNPEQRIKQALVDNKNILINFDVDVSQRVDANFDFLIHQWLDKKLTELVNGIEQLM